MDSSGREISQDSAGCRDCPAGGPLAGAVLHFDIENEADQDRDQCYLVFDLYQEMRWQRVSTCLGTIPAKAGIEYDYPLTGEWICGKQLVIMDLVLTWSGQEGNTCSDEACCDDHSGDNCWRSKKPLIVGCSKSPIIAEIETVSPAGQADSSPVPAPVELAIYKSAPAKVSAGSSISYLIVVENQGIEEADAHVRDTLPEGLSGAEYSFDGTSWSPYSSGRSITLKDIPARELRTLYLRATVDGQVAEGTELINQASLVEGGQASASTKVSKAGSGGGEVLLDIQKTGPSQAAAGSTITYTILVSNSGTASAEGVRVTDTLPGEMGGGQYSLDGSTWLSYSSGSTISLGTIPQGELRTVYVKGTVSSNAADGTVMTNQACLVGEGKCTSFQTKVATASGPNPRIYSKYTLGNLYAGQPVTYRIFFGNAGTAPGDVTIVDTLPDSLEGAEYSTSGSNWAPYSSGTPLTYTLISHEGKYLDIRGTLSEEVSEGETVTNTACVSQTGECKSCTSQVKGLGIDKIGPADAAPGDEIAYMITVTNYRSTTANDVQISDDLPDEIEYAWYPTEDDWYSSGNLIDLGDIAPGESKTATIGCKISDSVSGSIMNTANLYVGENYYTSDYAFTEVSEPYVSLSIFKSGPSTIDAGERASYYITVYNEGTATASQVAVWDTLPSGVTDAKIYTFDLNEWWPYQSGDKEWMDVPAGGSKSIIISFLVGDGIEDGIVLEDQACFEWQPDNGNAQTACAVASTSVINGPKLSVTKTGPATVATGGDIVYDIEVLNTGSETATDVELTDQFPDELQSQQYSLDGTSWHNCPSGVISLGDVEPDVPKTVLMKGVVDSSAADGTTISNTACIGSVCDTCQTNVASGGAVLSLDKSGPATIAAGGQIIYQIQISNTGTEAASDVELTDQLPDAVKNPQYTIDGTWHDYTSDDPISLGDIEPNVPKTVFIKGTVDSTTPGGTTLTNTACIGSICDSAETAVQSVQAELSIDMDGPGSVAPGGSITYTISVQNQGKAAAEDVAVEDSLPQGLNDPRCSLDGTVWMPYSGQVVLDEVGPGSTRFLFIRADVDPGLSEGDMLENTACLQDPGDPQCDSITTEVLASSEAKLGLVKSASVSTVSPGGYVTYTISYENMGGTALHDVVITEHYPPELSIIAVSPAPDAGTNNRWTIGTLLPDEAGTIIVTARVPENPEIIFDLDQSVSGQGFVRTLKDLSTGIKPYSLRNTATISSRETGTSSYSSDVTVSGKGGTTLQQRESGSGIYSRDDLLRYQRKNSSVRENSSLEAVYQPVSVTLPLDRDLEYSSKWAEDVKVKNYGSRESIRESYRYADTLERDRTIFADQNGSLLETEARLQGTYHMGYLEQAPPDTRGHSSTLKEMTSDYSGSFEIVYKLGSRYQNRSTAITEVRYYDEPHLTIYQSSEISGVDENTINLTVSLLNDGNRSLGPIYMRDLFPAGTFYSTASTRPSSDIYPETTSANWTFTYLPMGSSLTLYLQLGIYQVIDVPVNTVDVTAGQRGHWITATDAHVMNYNWLSCTPDGRCASTRAEGGWKPPDWGFDRCDAICSSCVASL
ncbi:MAG: DUF11 domain-containing protein [Methanotrichaceae archaeon]|nr:DUF11 domain-containing protein [Methanotrichaceae archaeon]